MLVAFVVCVCVCACSVACDVFFRMLLIVCLLCVLFVYVWLSCVAYIDCCVLIGNRVFVWCVLFVARCLAYGVCCLCVF